jgi:hypothetical protein
VAAASAADNSGVKIPNCCWRAVTAGSGSEAAETNKVARSNGPTDGDPVGFTDTLTGAPFSRAEYPIRSYKVFVYVCADVAGPLKVTLRNRPVRT